MELAQGESISGQTLLRLEDITVRVRDRLILPNTSWEIKANQHWAVLGPNGSGKSSLVRVLTGDVPVVRGTVTRNYPQDVQNPIGYVSLELHQRLIAREEDLDEARFFSGRTDTFIKVRETVLPANMDARAGIADFGDIVKLLEVDHLLDRPIRFLSAGEMRKVLIARALMRGPELLILDEPFEGLDLLSRCQLERTILDLIKEQMQIVLVTHRFEEIVPSISHILCLKDCKVFLQGPRDEVLKSKKIGRLYKGGKPQTFSISNTWSQHPTPQHHESPALISMRNVTVKYGNTLVLDNLRWTMKRGENWAVVGPNGSGKSTLLSLIVGDNPQGYANDIRLFGRRKGTGESIWEIKKAVGFVSSEFQVRYRKQMRVNEVVLSGFYDSIGLYRASTQEEHSIARNWMKILGITEQADLWFDQLSYGQKRMVLLARSMVKSPTLLVLDEPCQGLDRSNRKMIIDLIDRIGTETQTHILYVSHLQDEIPPCVTHVLKLGREEGHLCGSVAR